MELISEPDLYCPSVDSFGNYIDKIPSFNNLKHGLRCPCGSRKDKIYEKYSIFNSHIKTKIHSQWLESLNLNKTNYYMENEQQKKTIHNQQLIISRLEKDMNIQSRTIHHLTELLEELRKPPPEFVNNLLD
jgi:hypothetical protein